MSQKKIRVLIVDDSILIRKILMEGLSKDPDLEVVGAACNAFEARDLIIKRRPDVMTLDIEMPKMTGIDFLKKLMPQYPLPVVMVSSLTQKGKIATFDSLDAGAVDFVSKPYNINDGYNTLILELRTKLKIASTANVASWKKERINLGLTSRKITNIPDLDKKVVAIGASTGGTDAIKIIIDHLPSWFPPVLIVIHMPEGFTKMYAERLNQTSQMEVIEASGKEVLRAGIVLVASGNSHMVIKQEKDGTLYADCLKGKRVNGHMPSVSVLFESVAQYVGRHAIGVILTGMGHDGCDGLLKMKEVGGLTLAQDEKTSVIFGMPKVAIELSAVTDILPLEQIPVRILTYLETSN